MLYIYICRFVETVCMHVESNKMSIELYSRMKCKFHIDISLILPIQMDINDDWNVLRKFTMYL